MRDASACTGYRRATIVRYLIDTQRAQRALEVDRYAMFDTTTDKTTDRTIATDRTIDRLSSAMTSTPDEPLWSIALVPGEHWSGVLRRGTSVRLTALADHANVAAMMYHYESLLERYNMADTFLQPRERE